MASIMLAPKWVALHCLLLLVLSANVAFCGEPVKHLPGFDGELPFNFQTGYISVNNSEYFYYFIESQGDPATDPLFFWFTGGPGCSSLSGIVYEIGPIQFDIHNYNGGLPRLLYYPYTWTKTASFVYVDSPVGSGFSYSTSSNWSTSDTKSTEEASELVRKWLIEHPQYLNLRLFIGGDSYSGLIVPGITKKLIEDNDANVEPHLNVTGYLVGSPTTDQHINVNSRVILAHRLALVSDQLYQELKISCKQNFVDVDPSNTACLTALSKYEKNIEEIWTNCPLEPNCAFASPRPELPLSVRRSLADQSSDERQFLLSPPKVPSDLWCRAFNYALAYNWANDPGVQEALHVRKGKVKFWSRCNRTISYTKDVQSVIDVHMWLSQRPLEVLLEVGDHDLVVPIVATQTWLKILNLTVSYNWRPWYVDGQVAGYTKKFDEEAYGYRLTYATVKGGGHTAPEYYRRECYEMFQRWLHFYPL
ncbi:serine carboxypeptidase-like 9 [Prosopis cineraria]|uniref:serine carboxypeptidase-like 9 n=1 Tax=Prosopis cineraria TaxID=364024 RepID=UPI00240FE7B8|nr:serine carboxypeptidase-like 9 [Prosopis cineraria]